VFLNNKYRILSVLAITLALPACDKSDGGQGVVQPDWEGKIISGLFKKPVSDFDSMLYPEVTNLQELQEASERVYMPADTIFGAVDKVQNIKLEQKNESIVRLSYDVAGQAVYESYAYVDRADKKSDTAYLIIPGTGRNEAGKIFYSNKEDYHCCLRSNLDKKADLYVQVKPNSDFLAIHHKGKLLDGTVALFPQLISMGGSYSTRYLVDTIALAKHLKQVYKKVVIMGLSQGGSAALFTALQVQPDAAIISSGFSILNAGPVYIANIKQIVIPGLLARYTPEYIKEIIHQQSTQYLFTYGQAERGIYGHETVEKTTENFLKELDNAHFHYHSGGHDFPARKVVSFLQNAGL
jgi:predicted esterase